MFKVLSMEDRVSILIYEKNTKLNLILKEQILKFSVYKVHSVVNQIKFLELLESASIDVLILNFNDLSLEVESAIEKSIMKKNFGFILGYYSKNYTHLSIEKTPIKILKKPFKISEFLRELDRLFTSKFLKTTEIFLMYHLKFLPYQRVLINEKTKQKQYLTEKENNLLFYFYNNKNIEIAKNDLLSEIWGVSKNINTHTLETHIYRLKQKLQKIEPNLSFSLLNQNGLYVMHFEN